ncbi:hypothetical protein OOU_Y34scaffold00214g25 [Pyricularia oryzae Y34]|uniref:Cutinase n=1 Tax=Pyricularia oryzae (strain Y34) TaxID=1143189 RepID=A0AA97P5F6_PYRO3|nr:hypothetical protein OOU_Y34scaffold00214g25 [Pyricularia oryzae Y34]
MLFPSALLLAAPLVLAAPAALEERQAPCQDVHVFLARGTSEPYPGRQELTVNAICKGISSCGFEDIQYPAAFNPTYCALSIRACPTASARSRPTPAAAPTPTNSSPPPLQGAHVVGDILGGGGGSFQGCTQRTVQGLNPTTSPGNKIKAALLWGDVRHTANQAYNTNTGASRPGTWPRSGSQLTSLNRFSSVLRAICVSTDPVCAGGQDGNSHTTYFNLFSEDAAAWVKTKLN